jgi:glycosyltransferase involved in cell wall biosynthesis
MSSSVTAPTPQPTLPATVAMVSESQQRDGHQQMFQVYCRGLAEVGLPYSVYQCVDPGSPRLEMGVNRLFEVFTRRLKALPERIVHVNDAYLAPLARRRSNVVVTLVDLAKMTTDYFPRAAVWLHNQSLRHIREARAVVCPSEYVRQEILTHLPVTGPQVHVVPLRSLLPLAPAGRPPPDPPTSQAPWTLLYVAGDRPRKNIPLFLDILARMDNRYRGVLVSHIRPPTAELISKLGLQQRLLVRDWVEDLRPTYWAAHLLVHTAPYEGFGIPLAEAMSQGVPVVATNRTSIPEVVGNGGLLIDSQDPDAWCQAIEKLSDPVLYSRISQAALAQADRVSLANIGSRLRKAYGLNGGATRTP